MAAVGGGKEEGDGERVEVTGLAGGGEYAERSERGTPASALASPGTFQRWMLEAPR